ncbi:MAG: SCO1664 family protein [Candidatus Dormibacteria bacterium]
MSNHPPRRPRRRPGDGLPVVAFDARMRSDADALRRASRRFSEALRVDAAAPGASSDAELLRRLRSEPITGMGRVVYSSNAVFLIALEGRDPGHADQPLRAIYKPARGERPLWDFPLQTLHLREVAAYVVSAALDDGMVPATTLRDGPHGAGSMQVFVHGAGDDAAVPREGLELQLHSLAALDVLINNADRKRAHLLLGDDGRLHGIDNALSFLPYPRQRTVLVELGGQPLPAEVAARVSALAADEARRTALRGHLSTLLEAAEVAAFDERLDQLAAAPAYPTLDPWEGRPFEWW